MPAHRVTTLMTGTAGGPWVNQLWIADELSPTAQDAVDAVTAFWQSLSGRIASGVTITQEPEVPLFSTPDTPVSVGSATVTETLTAGGANPLPPATQGLIRLRTATFNGTRRVLGKIYVPYLSEEFNVGAGTLESTTAALFTTSTNTLRNAGLVVASRALNTFAPVIQGDAWNQFAVLRSRRD